MPPAISLTFSLVSISSIHKTRLPSFKAFSFHYNNPSHSFFQLKVFRPQQHPYSKKTTSIRCCSGADTNSEAREVLSELLAELGASEDVAKNIASNSPKYVSSLIADVRELDEHSLWTSWRSHQQDEDDSKDLTFRRKVYLMAKSKGDGGLLPFLESVGLTNSSALLIARYHLSNQTLPSLVTKVQFLKDVLFSSDTRNELIGRNARRMMVHLSVPADDDIQHTLSFFQKMEAKQGGLNNLGNKEASFSFLIESFPKLLLLSVENSLEPLIDFLVQIGVPEGSVRQVLLLFPPIFFYDIEREIEPRISELEKAGFKYEDIGRMLLKYPWIFSESVLDNYEKILSFFNEKKVPKSSVDLAIKSWPHLLGCTTNTMMPIVDHISDLGVKRQMLGSVISSSPQLLLKKPDEFLEVVSFMEEIGFDGKTTGRILCRAPEIFASNVNTTLRKKVDFLIDFGISKRYITRVIRKYPELLLLDIDKTLLPRMRYLMKIGLSKRDVSSMICKFSPLLGYSAEAVMDPKLEFLSRTMQKSVKEVVEYPRYFSYSLEKRIKPRYWVLKRRNISCSLKDMLGKNDEEFAELYILVPPSPAPSNNDS